MLVLGNSVLNFGLSRLDTNADQLWICSTVPTSYAQATTTYALGSATLGAGNLFTTPAAVSTGLTVASVAVGSGSVTANGTPVCWAVVDSANSDLMATGDAATWSAVTSGQNWSMSSFDIHFTGRAPVAPTGNWVTRPLLSPLIQVELSYDTNAVTSRNVSSLTTEVGITA